MFLTNITVRANPFKKFLTKNSRKAVAPVIATLLLIAVAVVGGIINFTFSQQFFNSAQASGLAGIESMIFLGYDATDGDRLIYHDGIASNPIPNWHGDQSLQGLNVGERVALYVENNGINPIQLKEVRLGGTIYTYQNLSPNFKMTPYSGGVLQANEFTIVTKGNENAPADTSSETLPIIQSGQQVSIIFELDRNFQTGRDVQLKLTTLEGGVFVYTAIAGQTLG